MKRWFYLIPALLVGMGAFAQEGQPAVEIRPSGQADSRIPVAVPAFSSEPGLESLVQELAEVIQYDLAFTGLFTIVPEGLYPEGFTGFDEDPAKIAFGQWRTTPAELLIFAHLSVDADSQRLVGQFRLFDVSSGDQMIGRELKGDREWSRFLAHRFSDEVVLATTGTPGIATTQITFSSRVNKKKELFIADYDGANARQVTQHGSISIRPKLSPQGAKIAYVSYKDRYPFIYVLDLPSGISRAVSKSVGTNSSPAWSPDGNSLAIMLSKDGNSEIYRIDSDGGNPSRLTENKVLDTSPVFSPDGGRIAFVSERFGSPQICVMNADGSGTQRVSYQGGSSYDPDWSPNGEWIAYAANKSGEGFEIYILRADNPSEYRRLTDSDGVNESPSWSPDSRHIVFASTRTGRSELWTINVETGEAAKVPTLDRVSEGPSWGARRD